jgi:hypothetical protein
MQASSATPVQHIIAGDDQIAAHTSRQMPLYF